MAGLSTRWVSRCREAGKQPGCQFGVRAGSAVDDRRQIVLLFGFAVIRERSVRTYSHAYLRRNPEDRREPVACHRCVGQGCRSRRHPGRPVAPGQAQGHLYPVHRHRRPRRDRQCRAVKLTGGKEDDKIYRHHSGYSGGLREETAKVVRQRRPTRLLEQAIRGMLPKSRLGDAMYRKLKVYAGKDHPHASQQPTPYEVA